MSQKWLEKSSNIYLQQAVPENLIPSKRLGKREKFRPKGKRRDIQPLLYSIKEKTVNQWRLSFQTKRKNLQQRSLGEKPLLQAPCQRLAPPHFPRKDLLSPGSHIVSHRISAAVGGNILEHLNQYCTPLFAAQSSKTPNSPEGGGASRGIEGRGEIPRGGEVRLTPYSIRWDGGEIADVVRNQIFWQYWNILYSLQEKARVGSRRENIKSDYKNQLTECRKVAILYGNLSKKTLVCAMRQARQGGGDAELHFFSSLERRLDVALKRAAFFPTIKSARQWIRRGKILVNSQPVNAYSYLLQPADVISINPPAQAIWREQCAKFLAQRTRAQRSGVGIAPQRGGALQQSALAEKRRFPFSPPLMEKWKRWSKLWGSECHPRGCSAQHRWSIGGAGGPASPAECRSNYRGGSALRYYGGLLESVPPVQMAHRRETITSRWLRKAGERTSAALLARVAATSRHTLAWRWLHQQQAQVCDGLYAPRWSRVFAEKKPMARKMEDWRWSTLKPLHIECSYKHYSAIFLYAPQKLAWPCSIKSAHLQKALV